VATTNVLLITSDVVGERMAGPGIRFWEFARVLISHCQVTVAVPPFLEVAEPAPVPDFPAPVHICRRTEELRQLVAGADVIVTLGAVLLVYPFLAQTGKPLVVDAYDPFMFAGLEQYSGAAHAKRLAVHENYRRALLLSMQAADLVICASDKQRDYWLGMLSALGRVNPHTHDDDPTLRRLIQVVPFGLPNAPPRHTSSVLKGVYPGIGPGDKVVLWGGGIWNWYDAPTAVRAMARIAARRSDVKLFFMGTERPNPMIRKTAAVDEAVALSRRLGLMEKCIIFNDWVPYADRQNYLLEADIGLSLHRDIAENRFAFRTRFMDYLWAGLPIVATEGDVLSDLVRESGLGRLVAPGDEEAAAAAILELLDEPNLRGAYESRFAAVAPGYHWDVVTQPLVAFCSEPRLAPDKEYLKTLAVTLTPKQWKLMPDRVRERLRESRVGRVLRKMKQRLST
jgi:glycosyltransferase involved in cell wall biosynthesis